MSDDESGESAGESGESAGCVSQISSNKLGEPGGESGYFGIPRSSADGPPTYYVASTYTSRLHPSMPLYSLGMISTGGLFGHWTFCVQCQYSTGRLYLYGTLLSCYLVPVQYVVFASSQLRSGVWPVQTAEFPQSARFLLHLLYSRREGWQDKLGLA